MKLHLLVLTLSAPLALHGAQQNASAHAAATSLHSETDRKNHIAQPSACVANAQIDAATLKKLTELKKHIDHAVHQRTSHQLRDQQKTLVAEFVAKMKELEFPQDYESLNELICSEEQQPPEEGKAATARRLLLSSLSTQLMHTILERDGQSISQAISSFSCFTLRNLVRTFIQNKPIEPHHPARARFNIIIKALFEAQASFEPTLYTLLNRDITKALIPIISGFCGFKPLNISVTDLVSYRMVYQPTECWDSVLDLSHNYLTSIHDFALIPEPSPRFRISPTTITVDLSHNSLKTLPRSLVQCCGKKLNLSHNQLTEISKISLPVNMLGLDLSYNQIRSIAANAFAPSDDSMKVSHSQILQVNLIGNPLLEDPQEVEKLRKLHNYQVHFITGQPHENLA